MLNDFEFILLTDEEEAEQERKRRRTAASRKVHERTLAQVQIQIPKRMKTDYQKALEKAGKTSRGYLMECIERLIQEQGTGTEEGQKEAGED